ncbi:hypothetical protein MASR2M48_30310 [Spirochaetota bacterium]
MSKSKGGFLTLKTLVDAGYDPLDFRFFLLGGHYRSQLQFSYDALDSGQGIPSPSLIERVLALREKVPAGTPQGTPQGGSRPTLVSPHSPYRVRLKAFREAIEDDFSTPRAMAELWGVLKEQEFPRTPWLCRPLIWTGCWPGIVVTSFGLRRLL